MSVEQFIIGLEEATLNGDEELRFLDDVSEEGAKALLLSALYFAKKGMSSATPAVGPLEVG